MVAAGLMMFPFLIPAYPRGSGGLSIYATVPAATALASALVVTIAGIILVCIYSVVVWKRLAGKVRVEE